MQALEAAGASHICQLAREASNEEQEKEATKAESKKKRKKKLTAAEEEVLAAEQDALFERSKAALLGPASNVRKSVFP
eukprot:CAMPEP_0172641140 /NCGR_PEP_ID=MMETSP1068-20121228/225954_1 /TAXON_ID=35684 /ORGANISM="Pseudopedinella elastica, Strain CCMP716" /LENGTH=77 /DNA_ID=CAMNT_0013454653 /DNA_START=345 /DNA_END=578 /DNA_ORIENTATION=+